MAVKTICRDCKGSFDIRYQTGFKNGLCKSCQRKQEIRQSEESKKNRELEEMILGKSEK